MLKSFRMKNLNSQFNIISKSQFLKRLSPIERYEFVQLCHVRNYRPEEFIYHRGDPATGMYILEKGRIKLIAGSPEEEPDVPVIEVEPPESFGAFSVGYDVRRMSTAQCMTDTRVYGFFNSDFETLRDRHPRIAIKFLESLNIVVTRQLETSLTKLREVTDIRQTASLMFDTYNMERIGEDEDDAL